VGQEGDHFDAGRNLNTDTHRYAQIKQTCAAHFTLFWSLLNKVYAVYTPKAEYEPG
jgi:hypothetical protein